MMNRILQSARRMIAQAAGHNACSRRPDMAEALAKMVALGVPVGSVIDVGVQSGTAALSRIFKDTPHLLIEPVADWNPSIRRHYEALGIEHEIVNAAASDRDGDTAMRQKSVIQGEVKSHAFMIEDERAEAGDLRVPMVRLDTLVAERELAGPYLLKIDVDGAEMQVLEGARETLKACSAVAIEMSVNNMIERAVHLRAAGFIPFEIVDLCYYDGRFVQADFVFLSGAVIRSHRLDFYRTGFDPSLWENY